MRLVEEGTTVQMRRVSVAQTVRAPTALQKAVIPQYKAVPSGVKMFEGVKRCRD